MSAHLPTRPKPERPCACCKAAPRRDASAYCRTCDNAKARVVNRRLRAR